MKMNISNTGSMTVPAPNPAPRGKAPAKGKPERRDRQAPAGTAHPEKPVRKAGWAKPKPKKNARKKKS